jgi:hypothetical protein
MNKTASLQGLGTNKEAREQLKLMLAHYLEGLPESTRSFHKGMKSLDISLMVVIASAFIAALSVSFTWKSIDPLMIPMMWFFFAASASLLTASIGLHTIILRAFPPIILPGKVQRFVTGTEAVWTGSALLVGGLLMTAFWVLIAYAAATYNLTMLAPLITILGVLMGFGIVISMIMTTIQKISKSR